MPTSTPNRSRNSQVSDIPDRNAPVTTAPRASGPAWMGRGGNAPESTPPRNPARQHPPHRPQPGNPHGRRGGHNPRPRPPPREPLGPPVALGDPVQRPHQPVPV